MVHSESIPQLQVVDVTAGRGVSLPETTMWFALPNENADMFNVEVYDPFVLVSYYMGMYFGQDVKICGKMSKLLYKNLTSYASQILDPMAFRSHSKLAALSCTNFLFTSLYPMDSFICALSSSPYRNNRDDSPAFSKSVPIRSI